MATSIFDLARQFGGVVENTKPQPEEDSLLSLARQFGGEVVETAPAGVEVEEPVNPEEQRRLGPAGPVGFGVLDLLVAPFAREKDPRLTGVARGAELLGSGLEATARVADILPEAAPPTTPVISTIKSAAPQLQEWANNLSNWGKQFDSEYATDLGSLTENPANAVPFIIERFIGSLPDMAAATYALPAYIPALANDILNQRLENDGKTIEQATIGDVAAATAAAAIQGPLERFATRRLGEPGGVLGQTAFQAGTEAAQEVTQYAAETAGTQVGFDPEQAGLIGLEAGIVGGGIGAAAGATNTVEQNAIRRNIEERFRRGEDVRSEEELVELDRLREKAFENAKAITTPELPAETDPLQFGVAYSERIYDSIGRYIDANEEFKVEQKTVDGTPRFVVTDRNGTQYGQALESQAQANALSDGLNNTTQERAKVLEQLYPLQRSLKEMMRGYGLNDIGLSLDRRIFTQRGKELKNAEGLFDPVARELFLAVDAIDPNGNLDFAQRRESLRGVLRHEVVHALRYLDLWKKSEWKNLENTVSKLKKPGTDKTYLQVAQENYALRDDGKAESPVIQMEEAVAELIRDVAGNLSKVAGKPRNLSERAINFFDRAKNALTGSGFQTYEDIVRRVEEGIVGSRQRGRIRTLRSTEFQLGERGITPERIQPFFKTPEARNQFRAETAQRMQAETPATSQPAINAIRLNASRESRLTIDPVPPKIKVDDQEFPTRDSEGRLIYSGYEGPEVFGMQTRPTQEGLQNFWRSFKGSKAVDKQGRPQLYLHGTAGDITAFRPKQAGSVFVTKNPAFAEEFGFLSDNYMVSNFPDFMSDQQVLDALDETLASPNAFAPKLYDEMYDARRQAKLDVENGKAIRPYALGKFKQVASEGRSSRYLNAIQKRLPSSANVMPVYVNAQKPWDYDNKDDVKAVIKRARDNGADITGTMAEEIRQGNWQTIEGSEGNAPILDAIRELGYDSMYVEEQGEKNLAVFNPNQIKSAIGNNGNFDIITPSIRESRVRNPQLDTPEFQRFIKDSKAVDETGEPQVFYHGATRNIDVFRPKPGQKLIFTSPDPNFASRYAANNMLFFQPPRDMQDFDWAERQIANAQFGDQTRSPTVYPLYVSAKNPFDFQNKSHIAQLEKDLPKILSKSTPSRDAYTKAEIRKAIDEIKKGRWPYIEDVAENTDFFERSGYDSIYVEEAGVRNLAVFSPNQLKSAVGNIGAFDITRPSIRESRRSPNVVSLMSNEEQPPRKLRGKTQVAQYLQDRALEALGGRVRDLNIEADRDAIADDLVAEAIYEMEVQKNALEWYDSTIERTIEMMAIKHPEIKTDPNARTAFLVGLAITSQNLAVPDNLKYSEEVYNHFKKNGRFPEKGFGSKSPSIKRNFEKANMLIEELGSMEAFTDFLQTEFTVGQLNPILKGHLGKGAKVGGELVGAKVYGSSVFGPKIGNGFYTNLRGDFSPVTIDMWFMRTIGRLRGKVMEFDEKKFGKQLARLAKAEGMEGASTDDLVARAQQLAKQHEKDYKLFKDEYKAKIRNKSESTNAAITIVKSLKATRDAPSTGREREQLRDIVNRAINKMRDRTGQDISPAAFQALIWYPEQDLYKKLGVKLKHVRQDYANSTKQFLRREGIDERELKRAEDRVRSRRQRRAEPVRPGAVAPVEAAVTPAGERVSEPVQVAEAVVPRARESRVTGPASVTEPGPDTDIDTTGAAEALNEGQPVNSLGIPVGPLLTYTMPDGTVAPRARESRTGDPIRGAKIDPVMKRLIRSVEFFESAPDKLRGGVGLGDIASRIENYYDTWDARLGEVNNIIRNVTNSMSRSELRSAQDTFERYMTARENNRAQDAADIFRNATPNDRQLISAWESITNITGRVNRDVRGPDGEPIKVWDSKQEKWRPIGTIRDFFPRTLRREVMEVMMNPDLDPLLYDQLLDAVVTSGKAQTRDEAEDFLLRDYFSDEVKSDYFAGVEKARTEALPEIFYDYSWNAATRYLNKWARRTSQIEYFGQELGPFKKDWFDTNIPKIRNRETQDYLNQIKDRIYEVETFGFWNNAMKWGNQLATGLQLGNPASAFLNVVGGDVANIQMYGWREVAKAHASLLLDWRRVQEEGTKLGILNKDYLRITQDGIERDAGKYFATEDKVSVALSKFTDVILTFSGFNGAENIVRATAMLAARGFLDSSLRAINRNPNSNKSKKFIEYVNRENLDLDKLILENGAGPETDKFMRRGVNVPQGSYRIDMTPVFVDTNVGRFFFKYQKFGTQINRFFYRNFFKPWWDDKTDALKFLRLLAFLFPAIFGGEIINQFRRFLGYSGDYGPTYAQISKAFEKDETALGWGLIISRAMQNVTVAGSFGFFGNYYQFGKDVMDQQRVKNPMSPPALSSVDALIDLGYRIYDQGQLTARDFDEIAENTMSFYRANKRIALASMSELGSEAKEVKRFVAQRDIREIRRYGLRYAQDMEIEGKRQRTSSGPPVRTEMTPTNKAIVDALYQGDSATARTLIKQALKGKNFKEKQKTNQSIRASIRSRQPIQIGGSSPNNQERVAFLKWAKKNLSAEEYQKIVTMDRRYRRAAARVNMGFGDD